MLVYSIKIHTMRFAEFDEICKWHNLKGCRPLITSDVSNISVWLNLDEV